MSLKERLKNQLIKTRQFTEGMLKCFETPQQWTHQVHANANHALWFAGHMGVSDDFFLSVVTPGVRSPQTDAYSEKFGAGSTPTPRSEDYPPPAEVLNYMRDRRTALLAALDRLSEDDLQQKTPPGTPEFLPDLASIFETAAWHEGLHSGQVTIARRALGKEPVMTRSPTAM